MREVSIRLDKVQYAQVELRVEDGQIFRCVTFTLDESRFPELRDMVTAAEKDLRYRVYG